MNDQNDPIPATRATFDDKPIGKKTKFEIPEYAETQHPAMLEENRPPEPIPLPKRVSSKLWKIKKEALDELMVLVREDPAAYQPFEQQTLDFITFNHAAIQQRGLKLALLYLSSGRQLQVEPKTVIKTIISKCMTSDKEEIKSNCEQILFWYMDNRYEELLLSELNDELLNKNPKIIAISILFIATLLNNYGIKRLKFLEKFAKHLELLSTPPKPMAKAQTIEFYKEVYRWMGDNTFKEFKIHMEVKDEITKFSKEYVKAAMEIKRGFRRQGLGDKKVLYDMNAETEENTEPLDVLSMYTPRWVDETLEIQKWKDKKAVLDEFIKKTKVAAIVPRENSQYISLIKRLLLDNNINLAQCGFLITQNLSKGLKKNFTLVGKNIQAAIFCKLRDGKAVIVEAAQATLNSLLHCLTLEDLMEDIKAGLQDKAPNMRKQVLKYLRNFASNKTDQKVIALMRGIVDRIVKMTEDGSAEVRVQALQLLCKLKITHDMRFFGDKLKSLDQKKLAAIKSARPNEAEEKMQIEEENYQPLPMPVVPMICESTVAPAKSMKDLEKELKSRNKMEDVSAKSSNIQSNKVNNMLQMQLNDLSSQSEAVRLNAYQQIASKSLSIKDKDGMYFTLKSKATKESSPNILKVIIQIVKKYSPTETIDLQSLQFLCMHDWRKCKHLLSDFVQNNRFSQAAEDYIRNNSMLFSSGSVPKITPPSSQLMTTPSGVSIKQLMIELQNLIPKMSNPVRDIKIDSADQALRILQLLPKVNSENDLTPTVGWNQDLINQFFNVAKFRLSESEYEIPAKYARVLSQMVHKGIAFKNKSIRLILPTVFSKAREGHPEIKLLMSELAQNNPVFIFSILLGEIANENSRDVPLQFIIENNELFIRNADLKAYMGPLLNIIFNSSLDSRLKNNCEKLLDQIVELCGETVLEAEVKKGKIGYADSYLAKFNIAVAKSALPINPGKNLLNRLDRQKLDPQYAWPITPTPSHILKLINIMISLKQPISLLATPLTIGSEQIGLIQTFDNSFLSENADILLKWVYWRTIIDPHDEVEIILDFAAKVVMSILGELHEAEVSILLSSLTNCLKRFHRDCLPAVYEIQHRVFRLSSELKQKCFLFWVNSLGDDQGVSSPPVDEILQIFIHCFSDLLSSELVSLARHPAVIKNEEFGLFLQTRCEPQLLNVYGFSRLSGARVGRQAVQVELKPLLSDLGGPQNMISVPAEQRRLYMNIFQKMSSDEMIKKINEIAAQVEPGAVAETHLKIIYSVVVPFMKREISTINMFSYLKEVGRFMHATQGLAKVAAVGERARFALHLKDLTRVLIYFLIDLDENLIDNKEEITRVVNRIILLLLEHNESRHLLEVLFLLLRSQMALNLSIKILHLLVKCIGKVCNNNSFNLREEDNLAFVLAQTHALLTENSVPLDHTIVKSLRNVYNDLAANHPLLEAVIRKFLLNEPLHATLAAICQDIRPLQNENATSEVVKEKEGKESSAIKGMGATAMAKLASIKKGEV